MRRIIYCSQATVEPSPDELVDLLVQSRRNNQRDGLSGMLLYCAQSFLQLLEGGPVAVGVAYDRITSDHRHGGLRLLQDSTVEAALFPDWTMGFDHVDEEALAGGLDGYTPASLFPLVDSKLVTSAAAATTLLNLYARNAMP